MTAVSPQVDRPTSPSTALASVPPTLTAAHGLAARATASGKTYGSGPNQLDCVSFTEQVVASVLGRQLSRGEKRQVRLDYWNSLTESAKGDAYRRAVQNGEQTTWGAPKVLVDAGVARYVENRNGLRAGDVVQYHWTGRDGSQRGHVGVVAADSQGGVIVERNGQRGILLVSAHSSASAIEAWEKRPGEGEPIGTRFVPLSEIQQFRAARMGGGATDSATPAAQGQANRPQNSHAPASTPNVENALSRIRTGDNSSYIREGSSGPEVAWLKGQLLEWARISGKVPASERATLAKTVSNDKMTSEWAELMAKFQASVGLNDDGTLNKNPKNGEQLAADRVWGIRSQRALDLFFGRENTPDFQAVSWERFKEITGGVWTQAQVDAAGYGSSDEVELGLLDPISSLGSGQGSKVGNVKFAITPEYLVEFFNNPRHRQIFGLSRSINATEAERIMRVLAVIRAAESEAGDSAYTLKNLAGSPAWGAYQFIPPTWDNLKRVSQGLISGERNNGSPEGRLRQDLAAVLLIGKGQAGVLDKLVSGNDPDGVIRAISQVWAGIPLPGTHTSFYQSDGHNRATIAYSTVRQAVGHGAA